MKSIGKLAALAALIFIVAFFTAQFFKHYPNGSQDWAAWIQAFGSVAAIISVFAVARIDKVERQSEARLRAQTIAFMMLPRLYMLSNRVTDVISELRSIGQFDGHPDRIRTCFRALKDLPLWSTTDLLDLVPLPSVSFYLSRAISRIELVLVTTPPILSRPELDNDSSFRKVQAAAIWPILQSAVDDFNSLFIEMQAHGHSLHLRATTRPIGPEESS